MTREELIANLAAKKAKKDTINWGRFQSAISSTSGANKAAIINAINDNNREVLFNIINSIVVAEKLAKAKADVDLVAADDSLSVNDLIDILG